MHLPDIRTMVLVSNLVALLMAAVFALAVRVQGLVYRPLLLWTSAFFAKAIGLLLIYLRSSVPDPLSYSVANALVVTSSQLFLVGSLEFVGRRQSWRTHAWVPLVVLATVASLFQWGSYAVAVTGLTIPLVAFDVAAATVLVRFAGPGMQQAQNIVAAMFGLESLFLTVRALVLLADPSQTTLFQPSFISAVFYLHVILQTMLLGTGLLVVLYRKAHVAERERVAELEAALAEVRTLEGMLPICAWCKRIRDEHDHWQPVEHYLVSRTDASFSHSICPDCAEHFDSARGISSSHAPGTPETTMKV